MATTTTYDVLLRYRLDNKATADAEKLRHKLGEAHHSANELGHVLGHIGMLAGGAMSIHGAWEHLVKFNSEVENAKISLAAMVEGGFGGSFEYAKGQAESLYKEFQKFSTQTPMTTQEMLEFSRGVAVATQQAGGSIQDIVNVTEQGAIAAKALGMESHYAAREIAEMLSGNVNNRMLFAKQLAGLGGKTTEDIRAMSSGERLAFLKQTLNSPAMKDAVSSMSQSFSGVTSTLIDKVQILLGKIGLPLFKAITAEVGRWNEWIDKNSVAIDRFSNEVAHGLVSAFNTVREVFAFIYDHADTFLAIGKVWASMKLGSMVGGLLGGMGGGPGGLAKMGTLLGTSTSKLGLGQMMGPTMAAGLGAYELGKMMGLDDVGHNLARSMIEHFDPAAARMDRLAKSTEALELAQEAAAARMGGAGFASRAQGGIDQRNSEIAVISAYAKALDDVNNSSALNEGKAIAHLEDVKDAMRSMGLDTSMSLEELKAIEGLDRAQADALTQRQTLVGMSSGFEMLAVQYLPILTDYQKQTLDTAKASNDIYGEINRRMAKGLPIDFGELLRIIRTDTADPEGKHKAITDKAKVNVTIHRIEVQSDDPDRYAFRFVEAFRDVAKNPGQSMAVLREG